MIKITKDLAKIPPSLIPAFSDLFPDRIGKHVVPIPQPSRTTHSRRMEIINAEIYTDNETYNSRYKVSEIKQTLNELYKGKCAFCEQNEELTHIEHYRPKKIYYWLAYSWDNLLLSCPTCNGHKDIHFDIDGIRTTFENSEENVKNINTSSATYDAIELPKMINPEVSDPLEEIYFEQDGRILSNNSRFKYTIEKCQIDRKALNDRRRSILDRFKEHVRDAFIVNTTEHDQHIAITTNVRNFIIDSKNDRQEFLAFMRFAVKNNWLNEITKSKN